MKRNTICWMLILVSYVVIGLQIVNPSKPYYFFLEVFFGGMIILICSLVIAVQNQKVKDRYKNQRTWVWCKCGNEMVGDHDGQKNLSFVRDVYVENRNVVHYKCSKCGKESFFDFDHPVPISLPFSENDDIIERYRLAYYG